VKHRYQKRRLNQAPQNPLVKGPYITVTTVTVVTSLVFEGIIRDGPPTPTVKARHTIVAGRYLVSQTFLVGVIAGMVVTAFARVFLVCGYSWPLLEVKANQYQSQRNVWDPKP
jgi:hypothetical protein